VSAATVSPWQEGSCHPARASATPVTDRLSLPAAPDIGQGASQGAPGITGRADGGGGSALHRLPHPGEPAARAAGAGDAPAGDRPGRAALQPGAAAVAELPAGDGGGRAAAGRPGALFAGHGPVVPCGGGWASGRSWRGSPGGSDVSSLTSSTVGSREPPT